MLSLGTLWVMDDKTDILRDNVGSIYGLRNILYSTFEDFIGNIAGCRVLCFIPYLSIFFNNSNATLCKWIGAVSQCTC